MPKQVVADTRTSKSTINLATGFLSQIIILVLNFVVRYIFIKNLGYNYLGINSLFSSILTILSVADLGFGSALGIVLYASLAKKNEEEIAGLMSFFKKVYLVIGLIVTGVGLAVTPFVKYLVNTTESIPNLSLYFLFFLANTVSSYFISYRTILIRADQKNSVVNNVTTIVKIAKALLEAFVLFLFPKWFGLIPTYFSYLGVMVLATYAIGVITAVYARKKYPYAFKKAQVSVEKKTDIISTTKDLLVYRVCNAFSSPIDSILISLFVGTALLGVYSNYLLIFTTLMEFICLISRNVISSVGNFVVQNKIKEQKRLYFELQAVYFAIIVFCTINFVSLVSPFINLVFHSESVLSNWVVFLFGLTLIVRCAGELAIIFRETTRIYKKTKYISLVYTGVHIALSILLGYFFGLEGILLGGVIAYFTTNFWFEIYALFKWYFYENPLKTFLLFAYVIAITAAASVGGYYVCNLFIGKGFEYFALSCLMSLTISGVALLALYPVPGVKHALTRFIHIVKKAIPVIKDFYSRIKIQKIILISYFVVIAALVLVRDVAGVDINKFIFLGVFAFFVILLRKDYAYMVILFTLPFSSSLAEVYIHLFSLGYLVITNIKKQSWKNWIVIFAVPLFLFGYEMIISTIYGGASIQLGLRIFTLLSILGICFYDRSSLTKKHIYAFLSGCLFMFIMIAINWIMPALYGVTHVNPKYPWLNLSVLIKEARLGSSMIEWLTKYAHVDYPFVRKTTVTENPNNIGMIAIVGMSIAASLFGTAKGKEKIYLFATFILFLFFGIWCQSRMFLIVTGILLLTYLLFYGISKRFKWVDVGIIFFTLLSIFSLVYLLKQDMFNDLFRRFFNPKEQKDGGRIRLLVSYLEFTFSNWKYAIFGVGINNLIPVTGLAEVPHSNFVQFIASYGMVIFILFLAFIVFMWIRSKHIIKPNNPKILLCLPLFFITLFTVSIQLFAPSIILITFIPTIMCISFLNKDCEKTLEYSSRMKIKLQKGEKIKVAICSTSFGGGIASYIANVVPYLLKNNFEVALVYNPDTTEKEMERFQQLKCHKFVAEKRKTKLKLVHLFKKHKHYVSAFDSFKPDIIYVNSSSFVRSAILQTAVNSYKSSHQICHCHMPVNNNSKMSIFEIIFRTVLTGDNTIRYACSTDTGKVFFGKKFGKKDGDAIIKNFIDTKRFAFDQKKRDEIRKKYNLKDNTILLGSVGRMADEKNQKFIIELMERLPKQYRAFIVGDGPFKNNLNQQIKDGKLENKVFLIPSNNEVDKYDCAFDYFLLPSHVEGLPFVSVEAQCSGVMNIVNEQLPSEVVMSSNIIRLPLRLDAWELYLLKNKPIKLKDRAGSEKQIIEAGYSVKNAPKVIIEKLRGIIYE